MSDTHASNTGPSARAFREKYGPWALVAGASKGLGAAYAGQLAARGLNLVLVARSAAALQSLANQLAAQYSVQVRALCLDLSQEDAPARIVEQTADLESGLLIYNAAYPATGPFFEIPLEDHLRELATNCRTPLSLAYLLGRPMAQRGRGGIILMSSLSAAQGSAFISNYAATKAYNLVLGEGLWEELRQQGADVLVCCPAVITKPDAAQDASQNAPHPANQDGGGASFSALPAEAVARETLAALGKRPLVIPGRVNRAAAFFMQRLLPRPVAVRMMGRVMRGMYGPGKTEEGS